GSYLGENIWIAIPAGRRNQRTIRIKFSAAPAYNLKNIDVNIPLGMLVVVTGVSGSGKSTLVHDVLYKALLAEKEASSNGAAALYSKLEGSHLISDVVLVDQSPIGRTPRSNPVTYIKAFDAIRELYASLP